MLRRIRRRRQQEEAHRALQERALALHEHYGRHGLMPTPAPPQPASPGDDFLPPDLRVPGRHELAGIMMRLDRPITVGGEVRACAECGSYRTWVVLLVGDRVRLRCPCGHESAEPRLTPEWFNRNSGPIVCYHSTLDEGITAVGL